MQEEEAIPAPPARERDEVDELTRAMLPTVEQAIRISVRRDPRPLVDAIFPVIGPATRKAIAEAFRSMVQSLSRSLEHSLSIRGLKWRFQALTTGRSFAEVVILNTLLYSVEQVFLIHRETGLLLQHVEADGIGPREPDMVSGMLTAVRDFVQDSFNPSHAGALETVRMGDVNLLVEDGPHAILAGVVRGTPPEAIRSAFSAAQEALHEEFAAELDTFDGDTGPFDRARPLLESCLLHQEKPRRRRTSPLIYAVPALLVAVAALFVAREISRETAWRRLVAQVYSTPGVLLAADERHGRGGVLRGAKDRQVSGLDALIAANGFPLSSVRQEWLPIEVAQPRFELPRIVAALAPPAGVSVAFSGDGRLVVSGEAPHAWVERAGHLSGALPGNPGVDLTGIVDVDRRDVVRMSVAVGSAIHYFDVGADAPVPAQEAAIRKTGLDIVSLSGLARRADMDLSIDVIGRADATGRDARNRELSLERAMAVAAILEDVGVPPRMLTVRGVGTETPGAATGGGTAGLPHNRCVTYRIHLEPIGHD